jgi:hypothetical protein
MTDVKKTGMQKSHASMFGVNKSYPTVLVEDYQVRSAEDYVQDGRVMKRSTVVTVHPQDKFKGLVANDFALENIIAAGAFDSLKEGYLSANTISELSDSMECSVDAAIAAVDAAEANNSNNTTND